MKSRHLAVLSAAALLVLPGLAFAQAQTEAAPTASSQPAVTEAQEFANMAGSSNMFEIESSRLALQMSQNQAVQDFAQQMIDDHTMAGENMMAAAETDGVTPPSAMNAQHQSQYDALAAADAASFDQAYIDAQVMAHEEAVALFEGFSTGGEESALRAFATETLPTLQMHLKHVQHLSAM